MKTNQKKCLSIIIAVFLVLFAGIIIISVPNQSIAANADNDFPAFTGQDSTLTLSQKSSAINYSSGSSSIPMLTVLIPDINEDASAWSKNYLKGGFSYNAEYLPEQIESTYSNAEIYSAIYDGSILYITRIHDSYFPIKVQEIESTEEIYASFATKTESHRVLLLSFGNKENTYAEAYIEVNKMITLALYDLKKLTNFNATVNIIGHGRGGLLGIQYANEHPTAVNAIYNIGTPHNGSDSLKLLQALKQHNVNLQEVEDFLGGINIYEFADGNSALLSQLKLDWNNITVVQNPNIKAYAYAGAMDKTHFKAISDLTSIFSSIDNNTGLNTILELITDDTDGERNDWAYKYLGEDVAELLRAMNDIKNEVSILNAFNNSDNILKRYIFENFLGYGVDWDFDIDTAIGLVGLVIGYLNDCYDYYCLNRSDDAILFDSTYFEQYKQYRLELLSEWQIISRKEIEILSPYAWEIYNTLKTRGLTNALIFGYTVESGQTINNTTTITDWIATALSTVGETMDIITKNRQSLQTISEITDAISTVMDCLPTIITITPAIITASIPTIFIPKLIVLGLITASVIDGFNNQVFSQFLDDIKLKDQTEFDDDGFSWIFNDEILFMSDLLVDYSSQKAQGYEGFQYVGKIFSGEEVNINKSSLFDTPLPFAHYLETMDEYFISQIMEKLEINNSETFDYNFIVDNWNKTATITGIRNQNLINNTELVIPDQIIDFTVTKIAPRAFEGRAFSSIILPNGLTEIGDGAFCGCENLTSISLPSTVKKIGDRAFFGCSINTVGIGENVSKIASCMPFIFLLGCNI